MRGFNIPMLAAAAVVAVTAAPAAFAQTTTYTADLTPAAVVPPTESSGSGSADITLDPEAMTVSWTATVDGLTGDPTAAHIHGPAAPGENAAPMVDMSGNLMEGSAEVTEEQVSALQDGMAYVNVHTAEYPDGEIRGQVEATE